METRTLQKGVILTVCIALPLLAGFVGSLVTTPAIPGWYAGLEKPSFSPPDWVFMPVWTVLYILMGISLFLIVRDGIGTTAKRTATVLFAVQLALNMLWSFLFFGLRSPEAGLAGIVALLIAIFATALSFRKISQTAALLLVPYICWTSFAMILNAIVALLN